MTHSLCEIILLLCAQLLPKILNTVHSSQARNFLAKHKKKKSKPTPDPKDSEKKVPEEKPSDIPETESTEPKPEDPKEPAETIMEKTEKDKKLNKLFWLRVGIAVLAGISATFLFDPIEDPEERRWTSIAFMIILFIVTVIIAKGMKIQLPASDRKKIVTQGIGSYVFLYLFMWIVSYTIVNAASVTSGIISPLP